MGRKKASRLLGLVGGLGSLLLGAVVLGGATQAAAQAKPAAVPSGFAGAETCRSCHEDQFTKFEKTKMGRLFLRNARNTKESLGCESCHGSGKAHVDAGGSKGVGGMISFAKDDPTPVEKRNETCTSCHTKGERLFWKGSAHESRDVACTSCHKVMEDVSPRSALAKPTVIETCGSCHLQKRAQQMRSSHMPLREGKMTCTSCHSPHGTVTPARPKEDSANETGVASEAETRCHQQKHPNTPLRIPLQRRQARAVPLGARARGGELRDLPRPPRLEQGAHAEGGAAAALPAVPHREPPPDEPVRTAGGGLAQVRAGTLVRKLPLEHPRLEQPVRPRLHEIGAAP